MSRRTQPEPAVPATRADVAKLAGRLDTLADAIGQNSAGLGQITATLQEGQRAKVLRYVTWMLAVAGAAVLLAAGALTYLLLTISARP